MCSSGHIHLQSDETLGDGSDQGFIGLCMVGDTYTRKENDAQLHGDISREKKVVKLFSSC